MESFILAKYADDFSNIFVQMLPELRRYIQHISLSPDSINNDDVRPCPVFVQHLLYLVSVFSHSHYVQSVNMTFFQAVSPLMKYLQDTMVILIENLVKENLTR